MKIPLSWLKEYVDIKVPVEELAHKLTMAGTEVGEVVTTGDWVGCTVGRVTLVEGHPNADRLSLCTVDAGGGEPMRVVCGAPNVAEGQKIAFARVGAELFNSHSGKIETLKAARIRGVVSEGMICSELELGTGDDHTGIVVLPEDAPVGMSLSEYLGDHILDLDVTPNRPDCLSVLGVAHEVAAITNATVREPDHSYPEEGQPIETLASVGVADQDLCPRYTASLIDGIKVGPSPRWLQERLLKAGMRPINNVVDITNYVMLEYNQPLHAFDFDKLKGGRVVVRRARPGEVLVSLDGMERKLSPSMLIIADSEDAIALGGIIGGVQSEMAESTTTVFLESASFNPANNRRTAQTFQLSTEATTRFEKGLRTELPPIALRRATQLIHDIAGGAVAKGILDIFPAKDQYAAPYLALTAQRLQKVLGVSLDMERVEKVLTSLGFHCQKDAAGDLLAEAPYWRSDIGIEDDLVEEVARIIGYDEIPTTMLSTPIPPHQPQPLRELRERIRDLLVDCGMQEVITYPVISMEDMAKTKVLEAEAPPLKLANPMSSQQDHLRTTLRSSLLSALSANQLHEQGPVRVFEIGRTYIARDRDLPDERETVAGIVSGARSDAHWLSDAGELGFYDAKGVVDGLLNQLRVPVGYEAVVDPTFHPGKCARIVAGNVPLGTVGEVHPAVMEAFGIERGPVAMFELDLEAILRVTADSSRGYAPVGRFPSAMRDIAVLTDVAVPASQLERIIQKQSLVSRVSLFDVYVGGNLPAGKRSLAYHIQFQSPDRTLTAEEVGRALQFVVASLEREVGAELRQ